MVYKLTKWLIFSVVVALLPILFNLVSTITYSPEFSWGLLLGRGELLLIAVGLAASALGDLVVAGKRWELFKLIATGTCVIDIAAACFYYALVSGRYQAEEPVYTNSVIVISLVTYVSAVICSGFCVGLRER